MSLVSGCGAAGSLVAGNPWMFRSQKLGQDADSKLLPNRGMFRSELLLLLSLGVALQGSK